MPAWILGNFLRCSKGVKDPLEVPEFKCDYPLLASAEMGVISSGGENLLDFLELRQVLSTYEGASGIRSGGLSKGQSPWELLGGLSGFLSLRCWVLRTCVESVPEPEDSSRLPTWIIGYFWSLARGVSPRLEWGHARAFPPELYKQCRASRGVDQGICGFPSRLSLEAFAQGCPTATVA